MSDIQSIVVAVVVMVFWVGVVIIAVTARSDGPAYDPHPEPQRWTSTRPSTPHPVMSRPGEFAICSSCEETWGECLHSRGKPKI